MKFKKITIIATIAGAFLLSANAKPAHAATYKLSTQVSTYIRKGNSYKIHLKEPGRVRITTKAKYKIQNNVPWTAIPYSTSSKETKEFYLRQGTYKLTTSSRSAKIKTSFTKLTKLRKQLDDYPIYPSNKPYQAKNISFDKNIKGFSGLFKTYPDEGNHYYNFTIDKPQKVTLDMSTMPIYYTGMNTIITLRPLTNYYFYAKSWMFTGQQTHKQMVWYLPKGTYTLGVNIQGRFNFKLSKDTNTEIPGNSQITSVDQTNNGVQVSYTKADKAQRYVIYSTDKTIGNLNYTPIATVNSADQLTATIENYIFQNDHEYKLMVIPVHIFDSQDIYGEPSRIVSFTRKIN